MRGEKKGTVRVWEVLFDGPEDGPSGPAADGTFIERFGSQKPADAFAAKSTTYGSPSKASFRDVPKSLARRWGFA